MVVLQQYQGDINYSAGWCLALFNANTTAQLERKRQNAKLNKKNCYCLDKKRAMPN